MTGTTEKTTPPRTDEEWARDTDERLDKTEHPESLRCGQWVLSTQAETGDLIASHVNGGSVKLADKPEEGSDPEAVSDSGLTFIKLVRSVLQSATNNATTLVSWNAVVYQSKEWHLNTPSTDVTVPRDGLYLVLYRLMWETNASPTTKAVVMVNGSTKMSQEFNPPTDGVYYQSECLSDTLPLTAGQIVTCGAFVNGSTQNFGYGPDRESVTSLTLVRLPVGE